MGNQTKFEVKVLRSIAEVEQMRPAWSAMQWFPEGDLDFCSFIINMRPEILRPHVTVVYEDGRPISLLAGRIEESCLPIKIGYKVLARIKVLRLAMFSGGFMGRTDPEMAEIMIRQLLRSLREEKADLLHWGDVVWQSDLHKLLGRVPHFLCRDHLARPVQHWRMSLPESLDELLEKRMNKKHRYWAKRLMRLLEKDFPGTVEFAEFSQPEQMEKLFKDVVHVARKTYQWGLGAGFRDNAEQKKRLMLEAERGWIRCYVLYLKGEPAAFWICSIYGETVYSDFTGYDPQYRKYEIGTVIFLKMIGELCKTGVKQLDFGPGTALYKERFGDSSFEEAAICVFASNLRGILLNALRTITTGPVDVARRCLNRLGLEQKLKKAWRRSITPTQAREDAATPVSEKL